MKHSVKGRLLLAMCMMALILIGTSGCAKQDPLRDKAQRFLEKALAAPSREFSEIEAQKLVPGDMARHDQLTEEAIKLIGGDLVNGEALKPSERSLYQSLLLLHSGAAHEGKSYRVEELKLTRESEGHYRYEAKLRSGDAAELLLWTGQLQFDKEGLIDYFTLKQ